MYFFMGSRGGTQRKTLSADSAISLSFCFKTSFSNDWRIHPETRPTKASVTHEYVLDIDTGLTLAADVLGDSLLFQGYRF